MLPHAGLPGSSAQKHQLQKIVILSHPVWTGTECIRAPPSTSSHAVKCQSPWFICTKAPTPKDSHTVTSCVDWNRVHKSTNVDKFSCCQMPVPLVHLHKGTNFKRFSYCPIFCGLTECMRVPTSTNSHAVTCRSP